jgi:Pro-kumamolisin, activation domain
MRFASRKAATWAAILLFSTASLQAAARQFLTGHVPEAVAASRAVNRVPAATRINLAIGLPLRNQTDLENLLKHLADPTSPDFRQYLTPEQFTERFGPSAEDYQALAAFFEANGLSVTGRHPNRTILDVSGTVAQIDSTFHLNMTYWAHPARGVFFAPDREPSLDAGVTILDVAGLDNFVLPRPMDLKSRPFASATPLTTGSGPVGLFIGGDYRAAYAPSVTLNGAGQSIGLFELDGFYASDVTANFKQAGLTPVPVRTVLLDGFNGSPGSANIEVILDIMMAGYMAPGVSNVIVYEGSNPNDVLNRMATDNLASQLSSSWGWSPTNATTEQIFKQMVAQGQSLFQASGDSGAYHGGVMPPSDDPNLTVVGGTSLTTSGPGGVWQSETTWPDSGGGVSTTWPIPSYQQSGSMTAAGGSASMRNIPDVALVADVQIFLICNNGQGVEVGGTSAAAPLWAGFIALANQQAAANKQPKVGFLNPTIYSLGAGSNYQSDLHDIVTGNNGFSALPGYDLATGWGTPAGQPLINNLTATSNSPAFGLSSSAPSLSIAPGASGASTITVSPQQGFSGAVNLTMSGLPVGVTASFNPASATTSSTLTLVAGSSAAASTSTLTITGASASLTSTARLALTITAPAYFTLSATPATVSLTSGGGSAASTIAISPQNGFQGTVTFAASGLPSGVTASFSPTNSATASTLTLTTSSLAATGTSVITITGTSGSLHGTATITLTVSATAGFTIGASPASVSLPSGGSGPSTITVTPQTGFTGTVSFSITGLPSGVTATFNPPSTPRATTVTFYAAANATPATSTITVTGTSGTVTSKATIVVTVLAPPSFTLSATPASLGVAPGASGTSTIAVSAQNGFNAAMVLSASGLPAGVTATFGAMSASRTSVVTFTATSAAAAASATVTITGTSGALTSRTAIALTIAKPPTFSLSASPTALSIAPSASGTSTLTLTPQNGFAGPVTVSASGLPVGVTGLFSAGATPASCVLTLAVSASAAAGQSTVTVTGKSGTLSQTVTIALTVLAPSAANGGANLAAAYNVMGMVTDGAQFMNSSGLDGGGRAYSGNLLGTVRTAGGASYNFGPSNAPGAASGATIALTAGQYSTLTLLATGVNGNQVSQKFTVTYADGSTASFTQSLSDWCTPQNYIGESNAISMPYRDLSNGTRDTRTVMLYSYTFNLSNTKTVKSITLPSNRNVVVLALNLGAATSSASPHAVETNNTFNLTPAQR